MQDVCAFGEDCPVNQTLATRYFRDQAIGQQMQFAGDPKRPLEIVGVVDTRTEALSQTAEPEVYLSSLDVDRTLKKTAHVLELDHRPRAVKARNSHARDCTGQLRGNGMAWVAATEAVE